FYERSSVALGFVRGLVAAALFELVAFAYGPLVAGPHVALPLYAAGYAALQRTALWTFATPTLALYVAAAAFWMGGRPGLAVHAAAGLAACALAWLWPYRRKD